MNSTGRHDTTQSRQSWIRRGAAGSTLDVALAWRMLLRHPGLSLVSVLGMAVGIAIAAGAFTVVSVMTGTTLPLPEGDRLVSVVQWDASTNSRELRVLHDLAAWRGAAAIDDLSMSRTVERNLIAGDRAPDIVTVSEITASAFRATRVAAFRGRTLLPEDERADAPDALVIGHDEWMRRFQADPDIVGRPVRLGATAYTIVGVMPEGFGFPAYHSFWIPWRLDAAAHGPRRGPEINVFGRLAPGVTVARAEAELAAAGRPLAAASPSTHEHLRPRVLPFASAFSDIEDAEDLLALYAVEIAIVLLLVLVCVNVAILVYARTAARQGEIAVRVALGASRRRIVGQLFVEALMLSGVSALIGIGLAAAGLRQIEGAMRPLMGRWPFWFSLELDASAVIYVVGLTLCAAAIVGVAPALKATGVHVHAPLQTLSPGGGSRMQMGRLWTGLVVAQVAVAVALLPMAVYFAWSSLRLHSGGGYATAEVLGARLAIDRAVATPTAEGDTAFAARYRATLTELVRRLTVDPRVRDVTWSATIPGREPAVMLETDPVPGRANATAERAGRRTLVRFNRVAPNFFSAFDVPVTLGRGLTVGDAAVGATGTPGVVVSRALVDQVFGGANPLGRRVKYVSWGRQTPSGNVALDRWYEIVGVVPDFPDPGPFDDESEGRVYHAAADDLFPARLNVRVRAGDPAELAGPLRTLGASIDPDALLLDISTAAIAAAQAQGMTRLVGVSLASVIASVTLLAAAGIYALLSFTVARRRREIGIRAALGANRRRMVAGIFSRVLAQLGGGAMLGALAAVGLEQILEGAMAQDYRAMLLPVAVVLCVTLVAVAAVGPLQQSVRLQPSDALRHE